MIGYVTLGTKDIRKAAAFYDKIAAEMGFRRFLESDTFVSWGFADGGAGLGLTHAFRRQTDDRRKRRDGRPGSQGPGRVDRICKLALSRGGTDEGAPGPRGDGGFHAAYFRDLDGNKLNAFVMG